MKVTAEIVLSHRETEFVRAICEGLAPSAAAVQAGYCISTAPRLMRLPRIVAALMNCAANANAALQKVAERKPYGHERDAESRDTSEGAAS